MTGHPRRRRVSRTAISIVSGVLVGSTITWTFTTATADPEPPSAKGPVRYELTGSGVAGYVTYQTDNGQLHATNVTLPWSVEVTRVLKGAPPVHLLSAQTAGPGTITCAIVVAGKEVVRNTATGDPARVICEDHGPPVVTSTVPPAPVEEPGEHPIG